MRTRSARRRLLAALLAAVALACSDASPTAATSSVDASLPVVLVDTAGALERRNGARATDANVLAQRVRVVSVTALGTPADAAAFPNAITNAGRVVGLLVYGEDYANGFLWEASRGVVALGQLDPALAEVFPEDINEAGAIAGTKVAAVDGSRRAAVWRPGAGLTDVHALLGGVFSFASSINDAGAVVGTGFDGPEGRFFGAAFLWEPGAGVTRLGTLGGEEAHAAALNNATQVVGASSTPSGETRAFLWERGRGMEDLGTLGGGHSSAADINDAGQVVGTSTTASGAERPFLWERGRGMTDLGGLPGLGSCGAAALNAAGLVVGRCLGFDADAEFEYEWQYARAFVWERGTGMIPLPGLPGHPETTAYETAAHAINDVGQVLGTSGPVSTGDGGIAQAVVWSVTMPTAGAPVVSRLQAAPLPPGLLPAYAPDGGVWLRVRLTDADTPMPGPWLWRIDWGNGVVHTPTVALKGEFAFVRATPYAAPGPHTITVSASDPGGLASAAQSTRVP